MIDFEWYRSFIGIYKHGSVSGAAKARFMTQPAMSQHLAALESEVGEPLFTRAPRKMVPTDKGKELYTKLVPLIENLESTTQEIKQTSNHPSEMPLIKLGSPVEFFTGRVLEKVRSLDIRYLVHFGTAPTLLNQLIHEEVDLIMTPKKQTVTGIEYTRLEVESFVVVAPKNMRVEEELEDIEAWLQEQAWLSYGLDLPIIRRYWREHFNKRPDIKAKHIIPNLQSILKAIVRGMGISVLPKYLIEEAVEEGKVQILFPEASVGNALYAAYRIDQRDEPNIKSIVQQWKK
ncbi:LysR family transcriptional regulator [Halobacillus litoralis]|uniref:LysR family transcriptional regulator n=1 Tax=Halobacillus litoralis TaxID=45668 RepID=A0A845DZP1_9BACI|nr:LysR family transcriptional regulator [Halobacillus litoralis]MYL48122.1 LysR family transcriptional regulator [Halobacillus litoralis]